MLPEERELLRFEAEQAALMEQVASAEVLLETIKAETARFQLRYHKAVGQLYAQLDELDALIAKALVEQAPNDAALGARAKAARRQAEESAEEAGLIESQQRHATVITSEIKQIYRHAVKMLHPDLAVTENDRNRRTRYMSLLNVAYERGDQKSIEKLIEEFNQDPLEIVGDDVAAKIVKTIRQIAQLRRRFEEIHLEVNNHKKTDIFRLKQSVEADEVIGNDPLDALARKLSADISNRELRLKALRG